MRAFYCFLLDRIEATAWTAISAMTAPKVANAAYSHHGVGATMIGCMMRMLRPSTSITAVGGCARFSHA